MVAWCTKCEAERLKRLEEEKNKEDEGDDEDEDEVVAPNRMKTSAVRPAGSHCCCNI